MCNAFQLPNIIIDQWMKELSDSQFRVLMTVARFNLSVDLGFKSASSEDISSLTCLDEKIIDSCTSKLKRLSLIVSDCNGSFRLNFEEKGGAK